MFNNVNKSEKFYFDTSSGYLMDESNARLRMQNNKQANNLYKEGQIAYEQYDYVTAFNKFKDAYAKCSKNYIDEKFFKE